jgi:hypothetical protein
MYMLIYIYIYIYIHRCTYVHTYMYINEDSSPVIPPSESWLLTSVLGNPIIASKTVKSFCFFLLFTDMSPIVDYIYEYTFIFIYIYIYTYIPIYMCIHLYIYLNLYVHIYTFLMNIYTSNSLPPFFALFNRVGHICTYKYICVYIHTFI